jgi:uncharacterized protein
MKQDIMDILCCPTCKADLTLDIKKREGDEIILGTLTCTKCHEEYPIEDGIPNLLPHEKHDE